MEIITSGNDILRKECEICGKENREYMNELINGMVHLMIDNQGCGIAAPQVGINKRFFVAVIDRKLELFVNPEIIEHSEDTEEGQEGCLSVPGKYGIVDRYKSVTVKYYNGREDVTVIYEGMNARIVQHEYDHLQGIIYTDKAKGIFDKQEVEEELVTE